MIPVMVPKPKLVPAPAPAELAVDGIAVDGLADELTELRLG